MGARDDDDGNHDLRITVVKWRLRDMSIEASLSKKSGSVFMTVYVIWKTWVEQADAHPHEERDKPNHIKFTLIYAQPQSVTLRKEALTSLNSKWEDIRQVGFE
ncbi:hypothetical protein L596_000933 [Steinernema carpocapsae]|uniref:Uncharacterized protein n=1 Tax=Steinernema carpocapsae TaxID=34508 RepID=A0A4V6I789_STECR|nr:hypothetical protein L596_000933 [Steinernema carpocapsae]